MEGWAEETNTSILLCSCSLLLDTYYSLTSSSSNVGDIQLTIGYDIRVYQGVNITISCTPLVQEHPEGYIHWYSQLINPRAVIRDEQEVTLPDTSVELVVPSTSIPNFLQESFRCEVCVSSQCWSNNSIISVVSELPQLDLVHMLALCMMWCVLVIRPSSITLKIHRI